MEQTAKDDLRFDDSPSSIDKALSALSSPSRRRANGLSRHRIGARLGEASRFVPRVSLERTSWEPDGGKGRSILTSPITATLIGTVISVVLPDGPIVENTTFLALVTVSNFRTEAVSGHLRAAVDDTISGGPFSSYAVTDLAPSATLTVSIAVHAPLSGLGHVLRVQLTHNVPINGKLPVVAEQEVEFDTAAMYRLTLNSAHVYESRSIRNDSVYFLVHFVGDPILEAYGIPYETRSVAGYPDDPSHGLIPGYLGDFGNGDDIPLGYVVEFTAVPNHDNIPLFLYNLWNDSGFHRDDGAIRKEAEKISLVFDLFSGGIAAATDNDGAGSGSVSFQLWYHIVKAALGFSCDGLLGWEALIVNGADLEAATASGDLVQTVTFDGGDSPVGCGSNSRYSVTRTYQRISVA